MDYLDFMESGAQAIAQFDRETADFSFLNNAQPDHICYKCSGRQEFEIIRGWFEEHGQFIYQAQIAGRPIATIRLKEPLISKWGTITTFELSDQKPDGSQTSRWDHIEMKHMEDDYDGLVADATNHGLRVVEKVRPHHTTHEVVLPGSIKLVFTKDNLIEKLKREMG